MKPLFNLYITAILTCLCFPPILLARQAIDIPFNNTATEAVLIQANANYSPDLTAAQLQATVTQLESLQEGAENCISTVQKKLDIISTSLKDIQPKPTIANHEKTTQPAPILPSEDISYLEKKKAMYAKQLSSCRLFLLRSDETIANYNHRLAQLTHYELTRQSPTVWALLTAKTTLSNGAIRNPYFNLKSLSISLSLLLLLLLGRVIYIARLKRSSMSARAIYLFLPVLAGLLSIFYAGHFLLEPLYRFITLTLLTLALFMLVWHCTKLIKHRYGSITLKSGTILFSIVLIGLLSLGYHALSIYLLNALLYTAFASLLFLLALYFIKQWTDYFYDAQHVVARLLHHMMGVRIEKSIFELTLIKLTLYACLISVFIFGLLISWHAPANWLTHYMDAWFQGVTLFHIKIVPNTLVLSALVFVLLSILGRILAVYIARHKSHDTSAQLALSSLLSYISFAIALIAALFVLGVDFTGIAIIAGALSIGVGLGLQTIVNNFVSGIILLLEKPIKPGDRIVVGDTEGFVKKVRIRSTQVTTTAHEDVIIPNADLVTGQIINYMFRDPIWRVTCKVGVVYGSNVALVKKSLFNMAYEHPDVIQDEPHKPLVLFRGFGDSALLFELWCVIRDVNKKYIVESELNFSIDACFRENGITIAFPQRDIHIKSEPHAIQPTSSEP